MQSFQQKTYVNKNAAIKIHAGDAKNKLLVDNYGEGFHDAESHAQLLIQNYEEKIRAITIRIKR